MLQRRGVARPLRALAVDGRLSLSETRYVATAPSPSPNREAATPASGAHSQPAAEINVLTTHDDFLLELGQIAHGRAAVRPVDSLEAAIAAMGSSRRGQVLVIDARDLRNVRAVVDAAQAAVARAVVVVFVEGAAERQLAASLKGSAVFALLPTDIDTHKTQAVLEGAISESLTNNTVAHAAHAKNITHAAAAAARTADLTIGAFRPESSKAHVLRLGDGPRRIILIAGAALASIGAAVAAYWYFTHPALSPPSAPPTTQPPAAVAAPAPEPLPAVTSNETLILKGKVDELLEKARLAMKERRFTEPAGDNALLYYRSAAAADAANAEAHDGLQRVAGVLGSRFDEAMSGARFDEAAAILAGFKSAVPGDPRVAALEQRLYGGEIAKAIGEGNIERAAALVRQAQQSSAVSSEQIARWHADISRHQEDARVQRLAALVVDRIREGRLVDGDDSAKAHLQQLQASAPGNANSARAARDFALACLRKARDAALVKNDADKARWLAEARAAGATAADLAAYERDLAGAQQKAAQAENERLLQQARERLKDGRLTDPAQDSAAFLLTQVQSAEPQNAVLAALSHDLAQQLVQRARTSVLAGKSGDADLALARRWGADAKELAAVQQLQPQGKGKSAVDLAALAASLKRLRATPPDYPRDALNRKITGSVTLEFTVDGRGETRDIHVIEAAPPGVFDDAAISAVRRWRYAPAVVNGTPVEVPIRTRVRFELPN
jgi:TonB family protein